MLILSGDIGGTNTRLCINEHIRKYKCADFSSLSAIIKQFSEDEKFQLSEISAACFAVAGPIHKGTAHLTNLPWFVSEQELTLLLDTPYIKLINDFEAIGYGIPTLNDSDLMSLHSTQTMQKPYNDNKDAPIAILGAGTGLGVALIHFHKNIPVISATEGGHVDFAPTSDEQVALLHYLRKKLHRISAERVCSGIGIINIYKFCSDTPLYQQRESPELQRALHQSVDQAATISEYAIIHKDPIALRTLDIFVKIYGSIAGNLALTTLPYQGLYLVGGIAPKLSKVIQKGAFMQQFLDKGRMSPLLKKIPVHICMNTNVGLQGAQNYALKLLTQSNH